MAIQKVPINPGVYIDDTPLTAEGFFIDADKIRFRRGLPEAMGGWELLSTTALNGLARGITSWSDNSLVKWLAIGTHTDLYALTDSVVYDITPIVSRGTLSGPFATDGTTAVITVTAASHGLITGQYVSWPNVTVINGASITSTKMYPVTVTATGTYTFVADTVSTSAGSGVGGTVYFYYYLAPGLKDSIGALGFGTGTYSTGTYSSPATGQVYARTWCLQAYGQNLMALARGGQLYEWAPIASNTELTTNGSFTGSATGWVLGTGWVYGTNNVVATTSNAAVTQSIAAPTNAFILVQFDVMVSAGTLQASVGGTATGGAISASGRYWLPTFVNGGALTLAFTGTGFTGTLTGVTVKQELQPEVVPNAPTQSACMVVTSEGFVMLGGTINTAGVYDPMLVRWSDIGSKTNGEQIWTPASNNLSSFFRPLVGSRIVAMKVCNNEICIWTDKALYAATYVNNSSIVYSLRLVGTNCGLIGANAAVVLDGTAYWMSNGAFYAYSGGAPSAIPSGIQRDVFDNISPVQQDKIFAGVIGAFNDIIWLYPDDRDGNECSRYALLSTQEGAPSPPGVNLGPIGVFAPGTFDRTCWDDAGVLPFPVAVSAEGQIFYQEKGQSANGGIFTWSLTHGAVQIGNGETLFVVDTLIPDFNSLVGGCTVTLNAYYYPQSTPVPHGPFNILSNSEQVSMLNDAPQGREIIMEFMGSGSPSWMRAGHHMFDIRDTGMNY